jgi:CheY-like chemotaxis protein
LQARRLLLARISHDLRSPLAGILDSARQWQAGETRRDYPHLIERHARQQMELIDELLEFSREELSDLELQAVPGYLHAFLDEVAEQAELSAERNGNRLVREFAHGLPALVRADFRRLRQVLANLLGNAAKFTRGGRIRFAVACAAPVAAGRARLRFTVQDDGIGIAPDERERLLLPFIRGGNASRHEGSGLGLAIVARLLDHMDSRLDIDAPPGGGSRFGFELELPLADEGELEPVLDEGGPVAVDGDGRVILVVDDQPQQREVTCDLLDGCGFETLAAADGGEALRLLRQRPVDLVLTDQYMGDTDGWTLLHAVRQERPDLPVLLYSALPPQRPVGMAADFTSALLKPASGRQLLARVDACLRSHPGTAPVEGG